jgi:phage terminase small subunit
LGLTKRNREFIRVYCENPSIGQTEAARRAGYTVKNAKVAGYELMRNPDVKREIDRQLANRFEGKVEAIAKKEKLSPERVIQDLEEIEEMCKLAGPGAWQAATLVKVAELKGKYLKMWTEKVEVGADDKFTELLMAGRQRAFQTEPPLLEAEVIETNGDNNNKPN